MRGARWATSLDRARHEAVTDFIDPPLWPAFNVADIAITLGAIVLVLSVFMRGLAARRRAVTEPRIVHSDDWLAIVDKPAGLVVHQGAGVTGPTMVDLLSDLLAGGADPARPGIVHRLDKDTSGLMIVARTEEAHRRLSRLIADRSVERTLPGAGRGPVPRSREGTIDAPLGRDRRAPEKRAVGGRGAREARTHFRVLEALERDALVEARLETGRTHQVRVHFAAIGHPLAGDPRYGTAGRHGLGRQFLHSARLAFEHPGTGAEWSSPRSCPRTSPRRSRPRAASRRPPEARPSKIAVRTETNPPMGQTGSCPASHAHGASETGSRETIG